MSSEPLFSRLAVLGVGYIGASLALAARRERVAGTVVGYDVDAGALDTSRRLGIVDEIADTPERAAEAASLVALAAPVASLGSLARRIAPLLPRQALVIDVGSVKAPVVAAVEAAIAGGRFVACHPLAGAEHAGTAAADPGIFAGRLCCVCPGPRAAADAVAEATSFWRRLGCEVVVLDADRHDGFMAAVSHLPHAAAFALAAALEDRLPDLAAHRAARSTSSLRDTTRVAASSARVWRDIFIENRAHVLPLIRVLERRVAELGAAVERADGEALEAWLQAARACRERLMHGA